MSFLPNLKSSAESLEMMARAQTSRWPNIILGTGGSGNKEDNPNDKAAKSLLFVLSSLVPNIGSKQS